MLVPRFTKVVGVFVAVSVPGAGLSRASRPATEEMTQRDRWVREHFPAQPSGVPSASAPAKLPDAGLMVWTNYGPVLCNTINGRPLQIADQKFEHGIYCHAPNDYEPLETILGPNAGKRITTQGGRPTNSDLPYFNIETGSGGGVIAVVSWAGQWAAHIARDGGHGLRIAGGQEATSFRLHPGEEVRSPLVVLQFYQGDWVRAQNVWRSWITDRVDQVLTQEGIDFYRQDFNIDPLFYWRGNDAEDRQGITEIRHVEGYFAYWDELVRRHPALLIDSCASGGRRNDLETLRRAVPILRSDYVGDPYHPDFDPLNEQNHIYGITFWMPYHGSGFGTIDTYVVRSLMGQASQTSSPAGS